MDQNSELHSYSSSDKEEKKKNRSQIADKNVTDS